MKSPKKQLTHNRLGCILSKKTTMVVVIGGEIMTINTQRIETMLAERGLTKAAYAANCGISRQNVSTIIRRGTAETKTVGKLAQGLGVSVADIIREEA